MTPKDKRQLDRDVAEQDKAIERNHANGLEQMKRTGKYTVELPTREEYARSERIYQNSRKVYPDE